MNKKYKYIVIAAPKSKIQAGFAEEKDGTGNYPFFTSGESIYYVDDSFLKISKVTGINVFMATGGTANIQKYSGVASYSTDTYVLKANKNWSTEFIYYSLLGKLSEINNYYFRGMGLKHLDKTGLLNVKIPVIDLYIQKQIATFLDNKCSKIDKLIELHKKKLELLGEYKKSLINECVNDGIPGMKIEERERIRMKYLNNGIFTGLNPRDNFVLNDDNACIYYVTTKDLDGRNILLTSGCDKVTKRAKNIINSRSKIAIGDVLFSCIGTIGRTGLIKNKPDNWDISESLYCIKPNNRITQRYLFYWLNTEIMAKYIDDYQRGSAQKGLRQEDLVNFQLEVVKKEFQEKICDYLDQKMFNQGLISTTINNKINLLYSYKTSLINEFVNGGTNV